jgi:glyoxylase-like metal-dependent hydrolase (beta-lactamase superfamily II)
MATREYPAPLAAPAQAVQFPHRNVADSGRTGRAGKQGSTFQELGPALPGAANAPEPMAAPPHRSLLAEMHGRPRQAQTHAVAEAKNLAPNKPIKYVVNTHHHFDHAGGLGAFAAEGATIITHDSNKAFLAQSLAAPRTIQPDKLTQTGKKAMVEGMQDKRVLSDATHIVELYRIQGTTHADGLIMAYLPKEKLLVEVDVYTPAPPNAAPPAQPNPASVNLYDNIERLKLVVDQILPLHGRKVPLAELQKWIGKAS